MSEYLECGWESVALISLAPLVDFVMTQCFLEKIAMKPDHLSLVLAPPPFSLSIQPEGALTIPLSDIVKPSSTS